MMKKIILLCLVVLLAVRGFAESGTCGENLIWILKEGTLIISGKGMMPINVPKGTKSLYRATDVWGKFWIY